MKINIISIFAPLAAAAILAGCDKTAPERTWSSDPDAVHIEASVGALTKTYPAGTEEDQKKFKGPEGTKYPGDQIAVSAEANGQTEKTVTYEFDAEVWNPVPATDYLVWKTPVTYKAWYPASSKDGFTLPADQSGSLGENHLNFEKADFMTGEYVCASKDKIPSDHKLRLEMQRKMALVTVNVDKNRLKNQFDGKDIYMIRVESIQSGQSIVSSDGTGSGDPVDVKPYLYDRAYYDDGNYHAIVVPCDGDASAIFLKITVSWDKTSSKPDEFSVTGRPAFEAGKHYTYNLTIGKDKVEAGDITVSDWGSPVPLIDGGGEQEADKLSDPISMTDLRTQLKAWNEANPENKKELKDLITTELLNENCKNGKLIISGEFDNTTPAYTATQYRTCHGMSVETLEAFEKIAAYVRDKNNSKVTVLDLSGVKGLTAIGEIPKKDGDVPYDLSFENSGLVTFIGSPDIVAFGSAGSGFWGNLNLVSVSGLENVIYAGYAFPNCSSLSEVPNMPKATDFRNAFSGTAIKVLCHKNVEKLTISGCNELTKIDCPKVNYLISKAFSSPLPKLTELRLTSDYFEEVHVDAFDGVVKAECSLWLNANQETNITKNGNVIAWTPKKSDGSTSAVDNSGGGNQGKTSISLEGFKAIYCGDKQIK